jgi:CHASE2 domain-containing sensor protein
MCCRTEGDRGFWWRPVNLIDGITPGPGHAAVVCELFHTSWVGRPKADACCMIDLKKNNLGAPLQPSAPRATAVIHPWRRRWLAGIVTGLCIEVLVFILALSWHWVTFIRDGDWTLDGMIRAVAASPQLVGSRVSPVPNLVFVDVDEVTWRDPRWGGGEPDRAPRDRLIQLVNQVLARGAQYVVLDILVEGPPRDMESRDFAQGLDHLLPVLRASAGARKGRPQRIILNRSLRPRLNEAGESVGTLPELQPSPVDEVLARAEGLIVPAAPYFVQSSDGVLREWSLWSAACQVSGAGAERAVVLPSVQLLLNIWVQGRGADASAGKLPAGTAACPRPEDAPGMLATKNALSRQTFRWLEQTGSIANLGRAEVSAAQLDEAVKNADEPPLVNRIAYRIFDRHAQPDAPAVSSPGFARLSARELLDVPVTQPTPWGRLLPGAIVVIGQSTSVSRDTYVTPLGLMSGALVIVNSIDSILRYGFLETAPAGLHFFLTILFVVLTAAVSARFEGVLVSVLAGSAVLVITVVLSILLFLQWGMWLDFTGPLLGTIIGVAWDGYRAKREGAAARMGAAAA